MLFLNYKNVNLIKIYLLLFFLFVVKLVPANTKDGEHVIFFIPISGVIFTTLDGYSSPVPDGGEFKFTVSLSPSHESPNLVVKANGIVFEPENDIYTISNITADQIITVSGVQIRKFLITGLPGLNGTIEPLTAYIGYGYSHTSKILPNNGYHIEDVRVDGVSIGVVDSYTFNKVQEDHTISATFELNKYTITSTCGPNGIIYPDRTEVTYGSNATIEFKPDEHYHITSIKVDNVLIPFDGSERSYSFNNISADHHLDVEFGIDMFNVELRQAQGVIYKVSSGYSSPVAYGGDFQFSLEINEAYNQSTPLVKVNGVQILPENGFYTINNITENKYVTIENIGINRYYITASAGNNGIVDPSYATVDYGANAEFSIKANKGYHISQMSVDNVRVEPTDTYLFSNVKSNHTLYADFAIDEFIITAVAHGNGTVSPTSSVVKYGENLKINFTPDENCHVSMIKIDGVEVPFNQNITEYNFDNVIANHQLEVWYSIDKYTITAITGHNGSISPKVAIVEHGGNQNFEIVPDEGYHISEVKIDGNVVEKQSNILFENVISDHTLEVSFGINSYLIETIVEGPGSVTPVSQMVNHGESFRFDISADPNCDLIKVEIDGIEVPLSQITDFYEFVNVKSAHTLKLIFQIKQINIYITLVEGISLTPSGNTHTVDYGNSFRFSLHLDDAYSKSQVIVKANGVILNTESGTPEKAQTNESNPYLIENIIEDQYITFEGVDKNKYLITAIGDQYGSVNPDSAMIEYGGDHQIDITPDEGCFITGIKIDGVSVAVSDKVVFENVTSDHEVEVTFDINKYIIEAYAYGPGTVTPDSQIVNYGETCKFDIKPDEHCILTKAEVDDITIPIDQITDYYQFVNVKSNHTLKLYYEIEKFDVLLPVVEGIIVAPFTGYSSPVDYGNDFKFKVTVDIAYSHSIPVVKTNGTLLNPTSDGIYLIENITMDQYVTIEGINGINKYEIVAISGPNGTATPELAYVVHGGNHQINITPNEGCFISGIKIDGVNVAVSDKVVFEDVTSNHQVEVTFDINKYIIEAYAYGPGTVTPDSQIVNYGETCKFDIKPDEHCVLTKAEVDDITIPIDQITDYYQFVNVKSNHTLKLYYEIEKFNVILPIVEGIIVAPVTGYSSPVDYGNDFKFTVTVDIAYSHSVPIVKTNGILLNPTSDGIYLIENITIDQYVTIEGINGVNKYEIVAISGPNGSATPEIAYVVHGNNHQIDITPNEGYFISEIKIDGVNVSLTNKVTFENVMSDHIVEVSFGINSYIITALSEGPGSVTPDLQTVFYGDSGTVTITPDEHCHLIRLEIDGEEIQSEEIYNSYTFYNVTSDHTLKAYFEIDKYVVILPIDDKVSVLPYVGYSSPVDYGANFQFVVNIDEAYSQSELIVKTNGRTLEPIIDNIYLIEYITEDQYVTIENIGNKNKYIITATAGPNGTATPEWASVTHGDNHFVEIKPDEGYHILDLKIDDVIVDGTRGGCLFENVTSDHKVEVRFEQDRFNVIMPPETGFRIKLSDGYNLNVGYGENCKFSVLWDENINIENVIVRSNSVLLEPSSEGEYTISNITSDQYVTIETGAKKYFIINVENTENGIITPSTSVVEFGGSKSFSIIPDEYYNIISVIVDGVDIGIVENYTFENVMSDHTIKAIFDKPGLKYEVKVETNNAEFGTVEGGGFYFKDEIALVKATEKKGFRFTGWIVDGLGVSLIKNYDFKVDKDILLIANFEKGKGVYNVNIYSYGKYVYITDEDVVDLDIEIFDTSGKLIYKGKSDLVKTSIWIGVGGTYMVRVKAWDGERVEKVIIL